MRISPLYNMHPQPLDEQTGLRKALRYLMANVIIYKMMNDDPKTVLREVLG